jgi:antitoxin component of MazEF toxin-antitoxin module
MEEVVGVARKWGNSLGVVLPREVVRKEKIRPREKVRLLIIRDNKPLREIFGAVKWGKSAQEIKDSIRRELYDE